MDLWTKHIILAQCGVYLNIFFPPRTISSFNGSLEPDCLLFSWERSQESVKESSPCFICLRHFFDIGATIFQALGKKKGFYTAASFRSSVLRTLRTLLLLCSFRYFIKDAVQKKKQPSQPTFSERTYKSLDECSLR